MPGVCAELLGAGRELGPQRGLAGAGARALARLSVEIGSRSPAGRLTGAVPGGIVL